MQEVEIWVMANSDGEYESAGEESVAQERFEENCSTEGGRRLFKITLKVPLPEVVEIEGEVPDTVGMPVLTAK